MPDKYQNGIVFDYARSARIGLPEAVFCQGKSLAAVQELLAAHCHDESKPILFTRLSEEAFLSAPEEIRAKYDYHALSGTALTTCLPKKNRRQGGGGFRRNR